MIEKLNEEVEILINEKNRSFDDSINFSFLLKIIILKMIEACLELILEII